MVLTDCGWLRRMIDIDNDFCCNFEYHIATSGMILFIYALFSVAGKVGRSFSYGMDG